MSTFYPGQLRAPSKQEEPVPPSPSTPPPPEVSTSQPLPHPPLTASYLATQRCPADPSMTHCIKSQYTLSSLILAIGILPGLVPGKKKVVCTRCKETFDNLAPG